jgi:hypothetical protein
VRTKLRAASANGMVVNCWGVPYLDLFGPILVVENAE